MENIFFGGDTLFAFNLKDTFNLVFPLLMSFVWIILIHAIFTAKRKSNSIYQKQNEMLTWIKQQEEKKLETLLAIKAEVEKVHQILEHGVDKK